MNIQSQKSQSRIIPLCVKLITGETLFTESDCAVNDAGFIKFGNSYKVDIENTSLRLSQYIPFSDDQAIEIHSSNVVTMTNLNNDHKKIYGSVLLNDVVSNTRESIDKLDIVHIDLRTKFESLFDKFIIDAVDIHHRYDLNPPELSVIKSQFDMYFIATLTPPVETLQ